MIHIVRPPEPAALGPVRDACIAAARTAGSAREIKQYDVVKEDLFAMQHRKCCYCEKLEEQAKYRDVEHYRPKSPYWWLAWAWDNLLFACFECNREYKRDQFPLAPGSSALTAEHAPPGDERPLLLDPADPAIDPTAEIEFRREKIQSRERWKPYGTTDRGRCTIAVCGLDRPGLLDLYTAHVQVVVRPKLTGFFAAHDREDARTAVSAWSTVTRGLLGPARPFRALAHDALRVLVPPTLRERYGLLLTRPSG